MDFSTPCFPVLHHPRRLLKLLSIELVMPSNHLILCCPLLLLPSIFPSIRVFSNESDLHLSWPYYWRFSFSISPSNEYSGLISFRINWFYLPAVQETLKSLLQHHSSALSFLYSPTSTSIPEKARATHSSALAWKITWTEEPGSLQSMGSLRVRHDWATSLLLLLCHDLRFLHVEF